MQGVQGVFLLQTGKNTTSVHGILITIKLITGGKRMSKYSLEINYLVPGFDISREELLEIIKEADRVIAETAGNPEKTAEAYLKKSQCLQKLGKYTESRAPIEQALSLFPDMAEAIVQLGNIYKEEKNHDEAIAAYNRAIQINPGYAAAFTNRGIAYHSKGEQKKAIADYTESIRLKPGNVMTLYNRASVYEEQGENDKAEADRDETIRLSGWSQTQLKEFWDVLNSGVRIKSSVDKGDVLRELNSFLNRVAAVIESENPGIQLRR
jgi:tetratricopeptide (TPR) repeat protein